MKRKLCVTLCGGMLLAFALAGCGQQSSQAEYIGVDAAKAIALNAAEISEIAANFNAAELEERDGTSYYAVDFTAEDQNYRYDIDAITGIVINRSQTEVSSDTAADTTGSSTQTTEDAGTDESASVDQTEQGADTSSNGSTSNTLTAASGGASNASSSIQTAQSGSTASSGASSSAQTSAGSGVISEEEAREIALEHAGLTSSQVTFIKSKLERDDGRQVYDIEFYSNNYEEYDYTIEASTGTILEFDYDLKGYTPPADGSSTITADQAKEIALAQVPGATASDIYEFETDYDDGRLEYEGTIWYGGVEYEFTIDGYSGAIREWEVEYHR